MKGFLTIVYLVLWISFIVNYFRNRELDGYYKTHRGGWYSWNQSETDVDKLFALIGFGLMLGWGYTDSMTLFVIGLVLVAIGALRWLFGNN
jgi:hypothetical protein